MPSIRTLPMMDIRFPFRFCPLPLFPFHTTTFFAHQRIENLDPDKCKEDVYSIECVGDASWPGFFHGVISLPLGNIGHNDEIDLGVLEFPPEIEKICNTYLLVGYEAVPGPDKCASEPRSPGCPDR